MKDENSNTAVLTNSRPSVTIFCPPLIKNLPSYLDEFYNNKNLQIYISKDISIKDGTDTVKLKKIQILEQIVNEHHFEKKIYQQDGIVNECYFCKQRCKM